MTLRVRTALLALALTCAAGLVGAVRSAPRAVTLITYGDMRFTDPSNVTATNPSARKALVARITAERPDAILLNGDVPWHGGTTADYDEFGAETETWRTLNLRVLPALGNHEFSGCESAACLEHWWTAFPSVRGKRWYSVNLASAVHVVVLDSMSPLIADSDQLTWLQQDLSAQPPSVQFVIITLHHPPVADIQTRVEVDHNPRANEIALATYLSGAARTSSAHIVVIAGHIHNYERLVRDNVVYLVSGGGGAKPAVIDRTPADFYQGIDFPNFHYVKLTITDGHLQGEMIRLDEPAAREPHFTVKDTFDVSSTKLPPAHGRSSR